MTVRHKCSRKVYGIVPCSRPATVQRDGKWWCWQHDPEYVAKKAAERRAAWEAKGDREAAKYRRIARNARLAALVTPELAALLERLASHTRADIDKSTSLSALVDLEHKDAKDACALAARIREALALETHNA